MHPVIAVQMRVTDCATRQQRAVILRHVDLAGLAAQRVDARVKRAVAAARSVNRQRTNDQRGFQHRLKNQERMQGQRGRCLRAVDQRQTFFGAQHQWRNTCSLQGPQRRKRRAVDQHEALAHQRQRHVRQRREITGCAHRAFGRNPGHQPGVVNRHQRVNHHLAYAGVAARQAGRLERQHQTHHGGLQRFAHAHAVRANQVELQRGQL